ncbi:hypothetical protein D2962_09670 [Biomaibacter acetigenes]|uniref:Uncharacterized protein n=1 Tax=Biomaibacter acetigenes TaxID=2316383 RepID=A0A3G2R7Q8_9FIRM|nr:hypothetical protein [Biomaibacter acetigenes]AYO30847.1 hypothetical protein D2962_09670 [Biomaibacter acetigenes]
MLDPNPEYNIENSTVKKPTIIKNTSPEYSIKAFLEVPPDTTAIIYYDKNLSEKDDFYQANSVIIRKKNQVFPNNKFRQSRNFDKHYSENAYFYSEECNSLNIPEYYRTIRIYSRESSLEEPNMTKLFLDNFSMPFLIFTLISCLGITFFSISLILLIIKGIYIIHPYYSIMGVFGSIGLLSTVISAIKYYKEKLL